MKNILEIITEERLEWKEMQASCFYKIGQSFVERSFNLFVLRGHSMVYVRTYWLQQSSHPLQAAE